VIYADNAATTKISDLAFEKMLPFLREQYGNASSQYTLGVKSKRAIEQSRRQVAEAIGSETSEVVFTSGGSEGNSWVLQSISSFFSGEKVHVITSAIEHHSILNACHSLEERGVDVSYLPVDANGCVSVADVEAALRPSTKLVSIMLANNEIGTIQPIAQIGEMLQSRNILFHTDAVQAAGHRPISVKKLRVDLLSASAHKFNGAKGTGFLYIRDGLAVPQYVFGGEQEQGKRAGTENVAGIVALGCALEESLSSLASESEKQRSLAKATIDGLKTIIPGIRINAEDVCRLPGTLNVIFPYAAGEAMMHLLDLKGICVSTSSACNSGKDEPSHVLLALGLSEQQAKSSIRISYGRYNTMEEAKEIVKAITTVYNKIRQTLIL
jgi:cysteine desulfurase